MAGRLARGFIANAAVGLFLLQALALGFSPNGRVALASGDAGTSIAMAGEICQAKTDPDGKTPAPRSHHHYCTVCSVGNHDQTKDAVAFLVSIIVVLAPLSEDTLSWFVRVDLTPFPLGWTSSWSSRAPPSFS